LGLIGNAILSRLALRDALSNGFPTEFFIKTGLLGASINLKVLVTAAGPAIIQALLLITIVFGFTSVQAKREQLAYPAPLVIAFALPSIFLLPWLADLWVCRHRSPARGSASSRSR
jgi:hypothetical protein